MNGEFIYLYISSMGILQGLYIYHSYVVWATWSLPNKSSHLWRDALVTLNCHFQHKILNGSSNQQSKGNHMITMHWPKTFFATITKAKGVIVWKGQVWLQRGILLDFFVNTSKNISQKWLPYIKELLDKKTWQLRWPLGFLTLYTFSSRV